MLIKQVTFRGVSETGEVFCQPILGGLLTKTASVDMRSKLHPQVQDFVKGLIPTPAGIYVLVNALGAGEYWGSNVNGDLFPEKALIHAPENWEGLPVEDQRTAGQAWEYGFPTFMGAYPYKHHANKDPSRAFGRVELAVWNPSMHRVELIVYLDRALCKQFDAYDVIERIERGEFPDVSMGCKVPYDVCTICEHRSKTRADYCDHAATMMNKILPDGRKVAVRNDFPRFFDISFVFIGADKTAKVMAKLAHQGNQVCLGDVCMLRSSAELGEMFSKEAGFSELLKDTWDRDISKVEKARARLRNRFMPGTMKVASAKQRLTSALVGGGVGLAAGQVGNHAINADRESRKKDAIKDLLAGAIAGGALPFTKKANDPIKKKIEVSEVPVWVEWKKGETRIYKDKKTGEVKYKRFMKADYGYIPETKDADGEEIDVYVGPNHSAKDAWVIKQLKKSDGSFDENKVMMGYGSEAEARAAYDYHMGGTKEFFGGIEKVPVSALRALFGENGDGKETEKNAVSEEWVWEMTRGAREGKHSPERVRKFQDNLGKLKSRGDSWHGTRTTAAHQYATPRSTLSDEHSYDLATTGRESNRQSWGPTAKAAPTASTAPKAPSSSPARIAGKLSGKQKALVAGGAVALGGYALKKHFEHKDKEKTAEEACKCNGVCDPCGGSFDKLAAELFPVSGEKSASHQKVSELIKSIPAGPFSKETLPRLEKAERSIPKDVLDLMGGLPLGSALSTPAMMGMILKPQEFQRVVLVRMGEKPFADELDEKNMTFEQTNDIDDALPVGADLVDPRLKELLSLIGLGRDRSAAAPALRRRTIIMICGGSPAIDSKKTVSREPVMKKLAAAYNGYRRALLKKAASIQTFLTTDPQLRADIFGESMAEAFAGGIGKVSSASVFGPDSLAYLVGAYTNRDLHTSSNEVVMSLAHTGAVSEAA